jgi:hypothetical protein
MSGHKPTRNSICITTIVDGFFVGAVYSPQLLDDILQNNKAGW